MEQGQSGQSAPTRRVTAPSGQPDARPPSYPGTEASVGTVVSLADAYWDAAHRLLPQIEKGRGVSSAPARLCAHAVCNRCLSWGRTIKDKTLITKVN